MVSKLHEAKERSLEELILENYDLEVFPTEILELESLRVLNLRNNRIVLIPKEIDRLKNLEKLLLDLNNIETIPARVASLPNLKVLSLENNKIKEIPQKIGCLTKLTELRIHGNPLLEPPTRIAELGIESIREYFDQSKSKAHFYELQLRNCISNRKYLEGRKWFVKAIYSDIKIKERLIREFGFIYNLEDKLEKEKSIGCKRRSK